MATGTIISIQPDRLAMGCWRTLQLIKLIGDKQIAATVTDNSVEALGPVTEAFKPAR
ncbi:MAG TPA: hypothetical protein VIE65_05935 [Methylobacter sp.]